MKKLTLLLTASISFATVNAQKLPNKQEASVRIPQNIKIDGKAAEWDNKFQAYNNSTDFYYTVANNDEDLYLIVQVKNRYVFNKIADRGLTLTVNNTNGSKPVSFTFPYNVFKGQERLSRSFTGDMLASTATLSEQEVTYNNKVLADNHKFIKVSGVKGVDSLVSLYNENGIQAAELFNTNRYYTLEMKVSLKLLGIANAGNTKISYGLKVNGIDGVQAPTKMVFLGAGGKDITADATPEMKAQGESTANTLMANLFGSTNFDGEYTLAK